jgi:hypothetical protein
VWEKVYDCFIKEHKSGCEDLGEEKGLPVERTLRESLSRSLEDLATGTSDSSREKTSLQNVDVMKQIKESDSFTRSNMLNKRQHIMAAMSNPSSPGAETRNSKIPNKNTTMAKLSNLLEANSAMLAAAIQPKESQEAFEKEKFKIELQNLKIQQLELLKNAKVISEAEYITKVKCLIQS